MRPKSFVCCAVTGVTAIALALFALSARADLPVDTTGTLTLEPSSGHRLYVTDLSPKHAVDSKVHVIDGDTFKLLGNINNGQWGFLQFSRDGRTIYNAASFFSRGDHGSHTEVLEFYDPATLAPKSEILIPKARASTFNYSAFLIESATARYLFIQNATPASSVTVVELAQKKVLAEIQTAGCFGIYPSMTVDGRFSTLCGDGAVVTIGFDAGGRETARKRSAKLFDPDRDALFITGIAAGRRHLFMSFLGHVHSMDLSGEVASQEAPWSIVTGQSLAEGWRPGGYQLMAYSQETGQLYVGMHPHGHEGSHKDLAIEIWKVDLARKAVTLRAPGTLASYIVATKGPRPLVYTLSPATSVISRLDGGTLQLLGESPKNWVIEAGGALVVN